MKDGKYEVGDVIAFRKVGRRSPRRGDCYLADNGFIQTASWDYAVEIFDILERIPNPKLMEGKWWEGWGVEYREVREGDLFITNSDNPDNSSGHCISNFTAGPGDVKRLILVPPPSGPCPELKAKIEKMEAELAELKKQALG